MNEILEVVAKHVGKTSNLYRFIRDDLAALSRPAGGECPDDATNSEVVEWFLRTCREMKPVGQWPGERVCLAIERVINAPRRFIADADMSQERGHNGRGGDGPQSLPPFRRAAAPTLNGGEDAITELRAEVERLNAVINSPQADDFIRAISTEAEHQRQRWGSEHDHGKAPADWFWLIGYLAGKALHAHAAGNVEKAEHHIITTAAACANWHRAMFGRTDMRPGISEKPAIAASREVGDGT